MTFSGSCYLLRTSSVFAFSSSSSLPGVSLRLRTWLAPLIQALSSRPCKHTTFSITHHPCFSFVPTSSIPFIFHHPHRNSGHPQVPTIRIKDNEEGHLSKYCGHNSFLHASWVLGAFSFWGPCTWKPSNQIWLLQPFLAPGYCKCCHSSPPCWSISSLPPATFRLHGEMGSPKMAPQ